jgi:class 3 adenylate cyclase
VLSRLGTAVRRITTEHGGRVVKQIGDAFMLVFDQRLDAVRGGAALLAWGADEPDFPALHVGAHAGEVLFHNGDYVGAAVNLAARVAAVTEPSQFLVTDELLAGLELPAGLVATPLGARALKGVALPVALSSVRAYVPTSR